jgi:hypothetical protein
LPLQFSRNLAPVSPPTTTNSKNLDSTAQLLVHAMIKNT